MGLLDKLKKRKEQKDASDEKKAEIVAEVKEESKTKEKTEKKSESKATSTETKKSVKKAKNVDTDVLVRPVVSEKAARGESVGKYTFVVTRGASKIEIKQAVKALYGILPTDVRVMNMEGKRTRFGRTRGKRSDWKKAVVTLPEGKTIDIHQGV